MSYRSRVFVQWAWVRPLGLRWYPASAVRPGPTVKTTRWGYFATGSNVPEAGPIRWGFGARLRAWLDVARLEWKWRVGSGVPQ